MDESSCVCCQMGHYCWNHLPLPALLSYWLYPCTEKVEKRTATAGISPSMSFAKALSASANTYRSGLSLAVNDHDLNRPLRIISHTTVHKMDMQCMAMRLHPQVRPIATFRQNSVVLTIFVSSLQSTWRQRPSIHSTRRQFQSKARTQLR